MAIPCEILLYPELLSNDQLFCIIQERHLHIGNLEKMNRCELLEIFRNFCVPYGQRKYRDSGRGKVLNRTRICSPEPASKLVLHCDNYSTKTSRSNYDRIIPPPDILSGHMKRIKLESLAYDINNSKRKMSIDSDTSKESPPLKKDRKQITWP